MPDFSVFVAGGAHTKPVSNVGRGVAVWNVETPIVGHSSIPIALNRMEGLPSTFSVEVIFSAAPGAFDIEVQTADTPEDKYFVKKVSLIAVNALFVGRVEVSDVVAGYVRLKMTARANAVSVTAKIN
jgi:hypothetical protein